MINKQKGFTLAEVMVVVGLIAVLLTMVLINLNRNRIQTRDNIRVADIQMIRLALEEYRANCGVFPATLELDTNNTRTSLQQNSPGGCDFELGDFIAEIPIPPAYANSSAVNPQMNGSYLYVGLSSRSSGQRPCFDYHIAVQLENGKENNYNNGENADNFANDHDFRATNNETYRFVCTGSGSLIENADDDDYGLYDFRSSNSGSR